MTEKKVPISTASFKISSICRRMFKNMPQIILSSERLERNKVNRSIVYEYVVKKGTKLSSLWVLAVGAWKCVRNHFICYD